MIKLPTTELFADLTSIEFGNTVYDLHNEYQCVQLVFDHEKKSLNLAFAQLANENSIEPKICLSFKEAIIARISLTNTSSDSEKTLNNFYRGRYERDNLLFDSLETGEEYFYFEFENGDKFELFSKEVVLFEI